MRRPPRGLTPAEAEVWAQLARTVTPLVGRTVISATDNDQPKGADQASSLPASPGKACKPAPVRPPPPTGGSTGAGIKPLAKPLDHQTLDAGWDRKLATGALAPDFTLDLHGATLDAAHIRLDLGIGQALAQGARVVLLITGRPRPSAEGSAGRGERRGAIRAKFLDWLAMGSHASRIAAIRPAHPRHGGAGAVYIVLRRPRLS